jgi:cobyrinic acid a,c-diamide synthase
MSDSLQIPRLVIAGTSSGVGKTTVMVGLCRALRNRGLKLAVFKAGPDYLDPTFHRRAAGVQSHTLDGWMMGKAAVLDTFARVSRNADLALVEGVMGLFDGASAASEEGSTAQLAKWLQSPIVLVVDASGMARTLAALVQGFTNFDPQVHLAAVICNNIGSRGHLELLRDAVSSPPIIGGLPKQPLLTFPERHLGLHTADEAVPESVFDSWAEKVAEWVDLDELLRIARGVQSLSSFHTASDIQTTSIDGTARSCRIGIAQDAAFHFYYEDNLRRLRELGAELVPFSPIEDALLPPVDGLYLGGGYPELYAEALSKNTAMKAQIVALARAGAAIYAECGGLMYLTEGITTLAGRVFPMTGLISGRAVMRDRLQALGYAEVETTRDSILGPAGLRFRGHQFRYSELQQLSAKTNYAYRLQRRRTGAVESEGYCCGNILGSYVHAHWASNPSVPAGFVKSCAAYARWKA